MPRAADSQAGCQINDDDPAQEGPVADLDPCQEESCLGEGQGRHPHGECEGGTLPPSIVGQQEGWEEGSQPDQEPCVGAGPLWKEHCCRHWNSQGNKGKPEGPEGDMAHQLHVSEDLSGVPRPRIQLPDGFRRFRCV
jgi:hypothetical protein